jgi:hypothetical protein
MTSPFVPLGRRSKDFLAKVSAWLRRTEGPPAGWVEGGWPKLIPLLLLPLALPIVSGAVRAVTGLGLPLGLLFGLPLVLGVAALFWPWIRETRASYRIGREVVFELMVLIPVAYAVATLYDGHFQGFPNIDGWDGGSHVYLRDQFVKDAPSAYGGFVSYYAVTYWL